MDWLKKHIALVASFVLHSTLVIGLVAVIAGVIIAGMWVNSSGWLAKAVPAPPTLSPVKIRIHGPTMIIRGGQYMFTADVAGPAGSPEWSMLPLGAGSLHVSADGKSAEFSTLDAEDFALIVSVAGDGKQIAHDHIQVEVLDVNQPVPPAPQPTAMQLAAALPPPPTIEDLTLGALETVESDDRQAEARMVAGTIRSVVKRLDTGLMPADADVVGDGKSTQLLPARPIALANGRYSWRLWTRFWTRTRLAVM